MESLEFPISAGQLGLRLGAEVVGDSALELSRLSSIESAEGGTLTYVSDKRFLPRLGDLSGVALLTTADMVRSELPLTFLVVADPKKTFSGIAQSFQRRPREEGISPQAFVHPQALLGASVGIGANSFIGRGARIGRGTSIGPNCYVGEGVTLGEDCLLYPRVTLLEGVTIGSRALIFPGVVVGSDGFGFIPGKDGENPTEVPQVGTVVIEDDVRIGANSTIDRATLGETRIGRGTKIDNLVHVGHNVTVGPRSFLCAQVGIAGSVEIGPDCMLGGQAGISDHVRLGKGVKVGAAAAVFSSFGDDETLFMNPALPARKAMGAIKYLRRLPEIWERLKALEERLGRQS
jgi:UDP-3-O-[3-hydroxymyristoyl] glucosamine N-acyltransferase